jgi:transcriptional regulator with XRE-family HTH domain
MADMTQQQIFGLEQGTSNVTIRTVARVAKVLDVDLNSLFSKVGSSSDSKLADAIDTFKEILVERGDQEQAFRAEMLELLGRPKINATRSDVKES